MKDRIRKNMPDRKGKNNPMFGRNPYKGKSDEEIKIISQKISEGVSKARKEKFKTDEDFKTKMSIVRKNWMDRPETHEKMSISAIKRGYTGGLSYDRSNRHWYNNGERETFLDYCPEGFKKGRLKKIPKSFTWL